LKKRSASSATLDDATAVPVPARRNRLSPKKLLLSKWTAVQPLNREKHFVVVRREPAVYVAPTQSRAPLSPLISQRPQTNSAFPGRKG
jgi:hypothetical protein